MSKLFSNVSTYSPNRNGETTFAVPDLRGEFLRGTGTATRNTGSGANVGVYQEATRFPNITASQTAIYAQNIPSINTENGITYADASYKISSSSGQGKLSKYDGGPWDWDTSNQYTSRPTNTSVLYCIKY